MHTIHKFGLMIILGITFISSARAQMVPLPTISYPYLSWCSYWYKTTYYPTTGPSFYDSLYTRANQSLSGTTPSTYSRFDNNGNVSITYGGGFVPTVNNFNCTYGLGTNQVSNHRETAEISADYVVPGAFPGTAFPELNVQVIQVDYYGNTVGGNWMEQDTLSGLAPGSSGTLTVRPPYMTKTTFYASGGLYYLNDDEDEGWSF